MEFEKYLEESVREQVAFGGGVVKAAAEGVLKSAYKDEDDEEGFLDALFSAAKIRANTMLRRVLVGR